MSTVRGPWGCVLRRYYDIWTGTFLGRGAAVDAGAGDRVRVVVKFLVDRETRAHLTGRRSPG